MIQECVQLRGLEMHGHEGFHGSLYFGDEVCVDDAEETIKPVECVGLLVAGVGTEKDVSRTLRPTADVEENSMIGTALRSDPGSRCSRRGRDEAMESKIEIMEVGCGEQLIESTKQVFRYLASESVVNGKGNKKTKLVGGRGQALGGIFAKSARSEERDFGLGKVCLVVKGFEIMLDLVSYWQNPFKGGL